jgi:hypothetical protein
MNKQFDRGFMIFLCLGKGKRFPHKPTQPLAQRITSALNV